MFRYHLGRLIAGPCLHKEPKKVKEISYKRGRNKVDDRNFKGQKNDESAWQSHVRITMLWRLGSIPQRTNLS